MSETPACFGEYRGGTCGDCHWGDECCTATDDPGPDLQLFTEEKAEHYGLTIQEDGQVISAID